MDTNPDIGSGETEEHSGEFKTRRSGRRKVAGDAEMAHGDRCSIEVNVRDVSASGFMAECALPVQIGSYVKLAVPGVGLVNAQIRWQIGIRMGGMFLDPISLSQCEWTAVQA